MIKTKISEMDNFKQVVKRAIGRWSKDHLLWFS